MAWSDAARRAAALARRLKRSMITGSVRRANDYTGDVRSQSKAIQYLSKRGINPKTGKKVGKRKARRVAAHIGDWANE